jgi:hypothetical protein
MSAAMLAALKNKRAGATKEGDHQDMTHGSEHSEDADKDLHSLASSLTDGQKSKLKSILDTHLDKSMQIAKGGSSSEEDGKVKAAMGKENAETDLQEKQEQDEGNASGGVDSDDIAKSMLDSKHLNSSVPAAPPRNLGERMKQSLAAKLKGKGKI